MNGSNLRTDKTLSISIEQQTESARTGILSANTMVWIRRFRFKKKKEMTLVNSLHEVDDKIQPNGLIEMVSSHSTTPNCIFCTHSHEDIVRTGQIASSFIHSLTRKALSHHCYKDTA